MKFISELKRTFFVLKNSGVNGWFGKLTSILILVIILLGYFIYRESYQKIQHELALEADNIDRYISILYQESTSLATYIGSEIKNCDIKNNDEIMYIFKELYDKNIPSLPQSLSWESLIWINAEGMLTVSMKNGVLDEHIDMRHRSYFEENNIKQWQVKVSKPGLSIPDNSFIIPAGMGITDDGGNFLGSIGWGYDIEHLIHDLSKQLFYPVKFLILSDNNNLYLASEMSNIQKYNNLSDMIPIMQNRGINKPIYLDDNIYLYHKHSSSLPLLILVGYNTKLFYEKILFQVIIFVSAIIGLCISYLLLVFYFAAILVRTVNITEKLHDKFIMEASTQLTTAILEVLQNANKSLAFASNLAAKTKNQTINSIQSIISSAGTLYGLFITSSKPSYTCLNSLVEEAIKIKYNAILARSIHIKKRLDPELPKIYVNPLSIKQVIVSIISRLISYSSTNSKITIETYLQTINNIHTACIVFQYKGFGLNENEIERLQQYKDLHIKDHGNLTLQDVKKIIIANNGQCSIDMEDNNLNTIEIDLPIINTSK